MEDARRARTEREQELHNRFEYHRPAGEGIILAHSQVRASCLAAAQVINRVTPICAEQTLAIRKLEEAMFWANAAIARNQDAFADLVEMDRVDLRVGQPKK